MTTALYRRYRPENFAEMIGQSQVTDPLMTALRSDRVGHAYLFSGPRGCGKTTSARILARCLNCAEGPTDTPCGVCPSCVELSRAGGGSLDVVEIDAASHNGVDDARDLRERATFAPSRDRFKIFILDEAHMVTPQGFNALLKLVEEPPAHVKFIFATTEPDKVLGTIRSRTHHYPFRLVPPAAMLEYVEKLCREEGVSVEPGVLPLVVRAGGGSPRDTLSLLDQLIAGSEGDSVGYARAVALLGYTHGALLDEIVDALASNDPTIAFPAVDRVVQTGQDPRRFVDDLLERLRDLIVIAAVGDGASAVLRGVSEDDLAKMRDQAALFGASRLSRTADLVSTALDDMTGATSPRLHLELLVARVLAGAQDEPASQTSPVQSADALRDARAAAMATVGSGRTASAAAAAPAAAPRASEVPVVPPASAAPPVPEVPAASSPAEAPATAPDQVSASAPEAPASESSASESSASAAPAPDPSGPAADAPEMPAPESASTTPAPASDASGPVDFDRVRGAWPAILTRLQAISSSSWIVVTAVQPLGFDTASEVLTVGFPSQSDVGRFRGATPGDGPSDHLRTAISDELGVRVKFKPAPLPPAGAEGTSRPAPAQRPSNGPARSMSDNAAPVTEWVVASIPRGESAAAEAPGAESASPTASTSSAVPASNVAAPAPVREPQSVPAPAREAQPVTAPARDARSDVETMPASGWYEPSSDYDDMPPPPEDEPPYDPGPPAEHAPRQSVGAQSSSVAPDHAPASAPAASRDAAGLASRPTVTSRPIGGGVQRYGEAVVRQVLGASFVREEPFDPPTRFN
ncbi:DNA polymerase III subunit gamma and tau [Microbacterium keratanolyticum]